jgi:hypothetical protein
MKRLNVTTILSTTNLFLFFMTSLAFSGNNTFPSSGNVGIGTITPGHQLHIYNSGSNTRGLVSVSDANNDWTNNALIGKDYGAVIGTIDTIDTSRFIFAVTDGVTLNTDKTIASFGNYRLVVNEGGNVGIGTRYPVAIFNVQGGTDVGLSGGGFIVNGELSGVNIGIDDNEIMARNNGATSPLYIQHEGGNTLMNGIGGNVGIGTTSPDYKLDVLGTIRAKEIKVETGWSDYVFDADYALLSLAQVESYIKENKHLPDIPSAKEIQDNGLSMAEMMAKQMQKIEELTLYAIAQNKKIENLENELAELKKTN